MFFKRCSRCNKSLFLKTKVVVDDHIFCEECAQQVRTEKKAAAARAHQRAQKEAAERRKKAAAARDKRAKQVLEREIAQKEAKIRKKAEKPIRTEPAEEKIAEMPIETSEIQLDSTPKHSIKEILLYESVLVVDASVKGFTVTEYKKGKKRVALRQTRELRRTHAGGFSAEKFQKMVDFKKKDTANWIIKKLERPGVLRGPYEKIIVQSADSKLEKELSAYLTRHEA